MFFLSRKRYTDRSSNRKSSTFIITIPLSFWYFFMRSPVMTYFMKLSSMRSKEADSCCIFSLSGRLSADCM